MALKNLVTAAFNKSPMILPSSVEDHPDWLRHQRQRDELASTLAAATDDVRRLQRERALAEHDVQETAVRQLLGDDLATVTPDADARIIAADAAIATGQARVATITEALKRLDARGDDLRNVIVCEMRVTIEALARDVVKKLGKSLRDAQGLSDELARLERYDLAALPVRHWPELSRPNDYSKLNMWLAGAQAAGWDV